MSFLLDTCILIDLQRCHGPAMRWLEGRRRQPVHISAVSVFEMAEGADTVEGQAWLRRLLDAVVVESVDGRIAEQGAAFTRRWAVKQGLDEFDALIAATAQVTGLPLITLNTKHFPMFQALKRPY